MGIESSGRGADKPSEGNESQETPRKDNPPRESEPPDSGGSRAEQADTDQSGDEPPDYPPGDREDKTDHPREIRQGGDTPAETAEANIDADLSFEDMRALAEAEEDVYAKKEADGNLPGEGEADRQTDLNDQADAPADGAAEASQAPQDETAEQQPETSARGDSQAQEPELPVAEDGDTPSEGVQPREVVEVERPHITQDYYTNIPRVDHERYLVRDPDNPVPIFDGPPERDQAVQGRIGDCGIISAFGAVAGHRPEAIQNSIKETGDGQYEITLHDVDAATPEDPIARPTGETTTYKVTDEVPVATDEEGHPRAGARPDSCGWPTLMEKVIAAEDQKWDQDRQTEWNENWPGSDNKYWVDDERSQRGLPPSPHDAPLGYNRLDLGSTAYQRADLLTQITGEKAEVRDIPGEQQGDKALLEEFSGQLDEGKPILVGTRGEQHGNEARPFAGFSFGHAYEVTNVENGKIHLRNPWGDRYNPPPVDAKTFLEYYRWYNDDGTRSGKYTTIK